MLLAVFTVFSFYRRMKRLLPILIIIVCIVSLVPVFRKNVVGNRNGADTIAKTAAVLPYRVIKASDSSQELIGYELFENAIDGYTRCFSAIVRSIDPSRDDYKI